jgi:hypothetical protein
MSLSDDFNLNALKDTSHVTYDHSSCVVIEQIEMKHLLNLPLTARPQPRRWPAQLPEQPAGVHAEFHHDVAEYVAAPLLHLLRYIEYGVPEG